MSPVPQAVGRADKSVQMLRPKAVFFLFYAGLACFVPYLSLYFKRLGFSGEQVGFLMGVAPFVTLLSAPVWGGLSDAVRRHKAVLLISLVGGMIAVCGYFITELFLGLVTVVVLFSFFRAPQMPLLDRSVLELLGQDRNRYGNIRFWGTLGWGVASPIGGYLWARYGIDSIAGIYIGCIAVMTVLCIRVPIVQRMRPLPFWQGVRVLGGRAWIVFLIGCLIGGMGFAFAHIYLSIYLEEIGAPDWWLGAIMPLGIATELVVMMFMYRLLEKVSPLITFQAGMGLLLLRLVLYSLCDEPWQAAAIQTLHGVSFGLLWLSVVNYAHRLAPPGLEATGQSLAFSMFFGLGRGLGAGLAGPLYEHFGVHSMYGCGAGLVFGGLIFMAAFGKKVEQHNPNGAHAK